MPTPADTLLQNLRSLTEWPPEPQVHRRVLLHKAFRESNEAHLATFAGWDRDRDYVPDPLPGVIAKAHADMLFGEAPEIAAANEGDEDNVLEIVKANELPSELHRGARIASSEGEVWVRVYTDRLAADRPLIQFVSRLDTVPLFRGGRAVAVAFITVIAHDRERQEVVRHVELHEAGIVENFTFLGTTDKLGVPTNHDLTADLPDRWLTGLDEPLAFRIVNRPGDTRAALGTSDYAGLEKKLFALNEVAAIGVENARNTLKERIFVDKKYLDSQGRFPAGDDLLVKDDDDGGDMEKGGIFQADYTFNADALIAYQRDLTDQIITRAGLVAQWVGASVDGRAETGTALRVRMVPAAMTAKGKSRYWTAGIQRALTLCQLVDAKGEQDFGFNRSYTDAAGMPTVQLADPIPPDPIEDAQRAATLVTAEVQSRRTSIEELHPEWNDTQVDDELDRIREDMGGTTPPPPPPEAVAA